MYYKSAFELDVKNVSKEDGNNWLWYWYINSNVWSVTRS